MTIDVDKLLAAFHARGIVTNDLRDGAHEAHHAIFVGLKKPWTRDNIHEALLKRARRGRVQALKLGVNELLVRYELEARAVEWIVCERAGIEYDLSYWSHIMFMETMKNMNILLPHGDEIADAIKIAKQRPLIERAAGHVIALADQPVRRRRRAA